MTDYSKQDLRSRVLHDMGVLDIAQAASATHSAILDPIIQQSLEELEDEDLVIFDSTVATTTDNIPGRVFSALSDFVRYHAAPSFGMVKDENLRQSALVRLRRSLREPDDVVVRAEFF